MRSSRPVRVVWVVALLFLVSLAFDPATSLAQAPPGPVQPVAPAAAITANAAANRADGDTFCSLRGAITAGTVITVNTAVDGLNDGDGFCSLREAITAANSNMAVDSCPAGSASGTDKINFDINSGVVTITVGSALPNINSSVRLDGSTQSGYSGTPLVRINYSGTVLQLNAATNATVKALDLSYYRSGSSSYGLYIASSNNVTVTNALISNRSTGIYIFGGQDVRILNSDLRRSGVGSWSYALTVYNVTSGGNLPRGLLVRGNRFGDGDNGVQLQNLSNQRISDGSLANSNVIISDTSGLNRTVGTALYLSNLTGVAVDNLDLSYTLSGYGSYGLSGSGNNNITVTHVVAAHRYTGISLSGGRDARVVNNDLRQAGYSGSYGLSMSGITPGGSVPGGVLVRGNLYGNSQDGVILQNIANLTISDGSLPGSNVILSDTCGLNQTSGMALNLSSMTNTRLEGLELSYAGGGTSGYGLYATSCTGLSVRQVTVAGRSTGVYIVGGQTVKVYDSALGTGTVSGQGIYLSSSTNVTVTNVTAVNRQTAVYVYGGRDVRVVNNDLRQSGIGSWSYALTVYNVTSGGALPRGLLVRGNLFGDGDNGVQLQTMSNQRISDGSLANSNVIISDTSGLNRTVGTALYLSSLTGSVVDDLDLSYTLSGYGNYGLNGSGNNNITVTHVLAAHRYTGVSLSGGRDARVVNNDLRQAGYSGSYGLSMSGVGGGVLVRGNLYGNSQNGVQLQSMANLIVSDGSLVGTHVFLTDTCGLNQTSGTALNLSSMTSTRVEGLELSYAGGGTSGYGLYATSCTGLSVRQVTVAGRSTGVYIAGGQTVKVYDSALGTGTVGGQGLYLSSSTNVTVTNVTAVNRQTAVYVYGGRDVRVVNNDLRQSGIGSWSYALTAYNVTAGSLPRGLLVRGNLFGNGDNGVQLQNMSNQRISDGSLSGSNVILTDTCGLNQTVGTALYLSSLTGSVVDDLDLSYTLSGYGNYGLSGSGNNNITVTHVLAARRYTGVSLSGGKDARVVNNDLRQAGYSGSYGLLISGVTPGGNVPGGVLVRGNLYGNSQNGVQLQSMANLIVSDGSLVGTHVFLTDTCGLNQTSGTALNLASMTNTRLEGLELSYAGGGTSGYGLYATSCTELSVRQVTVAGRSTGVYIVGGQTVKVYDSALGTGTVSGQGIYLSSSTNVTVTNVTAVNRQTAVYVYGGRDVRVVNNDLRQSGIGSWSYALTVYNVTSGGALPRGLLVRGNLFGDGDNGVQLQTMSNQRISDGSLANSNVIISDTSGLNRTVGTALYLSSLTGSVVDDLDLSYTLSGYGNYGLNGSGNNNITVTHVVAAHRYTGVSLSGGRDARVVNNDMRQAGYSGSYGLYLSGVTPGGSVPGGVLVRGNLYGNSQNGVQLQSMANLAISDGSLVGSNVILSDTCGLSQTTGTALYLISMNPVVVNNLDLSYGGVGKTGSGLRANSCSSLTITQLTISNRSTGIDVIAGATTRIDCSGFCNNNTGIYSWSAVTDTVVWNNFFQGNSSAALRNPVAPLILAENNYWGSPSGPSNLGGTGDSYSGNVDASPFLSAFPPCVVIPTPCAPTEVRLISFAATAEVGHIVITWETASERNNVGFDLYRRELGTDSFTRLNGELIPSRSPGGDAGASYSFVDESGEVGVTYEYLLEDIDLNGRRTAHGPVQAVPLYRILIPIVYKH